ncbi:hypothetical protein [Microbacterium murale]|uniref:Glycosyltransferase RgtA/B/C/D-like domain-containing protein n=1 Tax=Microbacterium murale TaxID=1081040 RepID=A0ABQ1RRD6_9MICO|nr:hypothetical protein [Microbacterium murale]GGD75530.1 hypothetical protein GCM10007269_18250 [Microbacterium murale]
MIRARSIVFWVLAAALLVGHVLVAWQSLTVWRFWEDEAFNLTVPRNLLAGLGYASDGALSGSTITLFDARISTGPAVLLPVAAVLATGIDPVIGARLVPLAYWVLLLAGLWMIGRRIGGRWAALVAVAVPLAFTTSATVSPIQGPADLLGEIPAAALLVWALVVLPRRAWLAGLLVGLAVQAKLIALLALPAFAVALFLLAPGTGRARVLAFLRRSWVPVVFLALPTFLFELAALITFGFSGFVDHLRALLGFVRSGGQPGEPTTVVQKITTLAESWSVPVWVALVVAVVSVVLIVGGLWVSRGSVSSDVLVYLGAAAVGALAFVGWWATASHLPLWVRHPAPGVFAFFPILAAGAVWGAQRMLRRPALRIVSVVAVGVVILGLGAGAVVHSVAATQPPWLTLETQRAAVAPLQEWVEENDVAWLAAEPWGAAVAPVVMTGAHVGLFDAAAMADVPRLTGAECATEVLADGGLFRICAAP